MSFQISRRTLLKFFGASASVAALEPIAAPLLNGSVAFADNAAFGFTPVRLPHPLPIYQRLKSFVAAAGGTGSVLPAAEDAQLNEYTVLDDVIVAPEYERYVIVRWGDRVYPNDDDYFGFNCDYTAFVPIRKRDDDDDDEKERGERRGYLWVNHEYVSYPFSTLAPATAAGLFNTPTTHEAVLGFSLPSGNASAEKLKDRLAGLTADERRLLIGEFHYNQGGSVVVISRKNRKSHFEVESGNKKNRRIHGLSGLAINSERPDDYKGVTSWGSAPHQQGDHHYLVGTGPAAKEVFSLSSDKLGNRIIGTAYNCSGATTPWHTVISAEENFQGSTSGDSPQFIGVQEAVLPNGTQTEYLPATGAVVASGTEFGLVGEKYGWLVEIDPDDSDFRPRKHSWLGRYRHENIALRVEPEQPLVAYMGDDRRGGHVWKFVSKKNVHHPKSKDNSALFEEGALFVAKFSSDGIGQWIPVALNSPVNPVVPSELGSAELAALGSISRDGNTRFPKRIGVAGQTSDGGPLTVLISGLTSPVMTEAQVIEGYKTRGGTKSAATLADYYTSQGAILCDAVLAANLAGGTPCARPEDIEVNPHNAREVFIAFTDGAPGSDGYPDSRIFQVSKTSSAVDGTQQSGGLYKISENSADSTGTTFKWSKLEQGGEAGSVGGSGFAAIDNLVFDKKGHVWCVTDMSTGFHNGFSEGNPSAPTTIDHSITGDVSALVGVFGANWLFVIPTSGKEAGEVIPFAYGPVRCEMTGPTFVGNTLILAVQHPCEDVLIEPVKLERDIEMLNLDGTLFTQKRTVPGGSNWPSNIEGDESGPPKPSVIGIIRKDPRRSFF